MKTEDQVVSVEPSKELKGLGVKQDSLWFWTWVEWNEEVEWVLILEDKRAGLKKKTFSAFTVAELGEMLPYGFYSYYDVFDGWQCVSSWGFNNNIINPSKTVDTSLGPMTIPPALSRLSEEGTTEANARAKMLRYLIKEGIIKVEELK